MEPRTVEIDTNKTIPPTAASAVTILLTNEQTSDLDEIAVILRRSSGHVLSRSAIIRALIRAAVPYHEDWIHCKSEEDLYQALCRQLRGDK